MVIDFCTVSGYMKLNRIKLSENELVKPFSIIQKGLL